MSQGEYLQVSHPILDDRVEHRRQPLPLSSDRSKRLAAPLLMLSFLNLTIAMAPAQAQNAPQPLAQCADRGLKITAAVTTDPDWQAKWKSAGNSPSFQLADRARTGDTVAALAFFEGAGSEGGRHTVECEVTVTDPAGKARRQEPAICFDHHVGDQVDQVRLAEKGAMFKVVPTMPAGIWTVAFTVRDLIRSTGCSLEVGISINEGD